MSVWRTVLATLLPWFFKSTVDVAAAAANKTSVADAIKKNIDAASADPKVAAATDAALNETVRKVGK